MKQDYKERAARAERAAALLDAALAAVISALAPLRAGSRDGCTMGEISAAADVAQAALDRWTAHQADYDTLDAADSDPDPDPAA